MVNCLCITHVYVSCYSHDGRLAEMMPLFKSQALGNFFVCLVVVFMAIQVVASKNHAHIGDN